MIERKRQADPSPRLKNIGPKSKAWLEEIGVHTREDLEQMGAVLAYRILKHRRPEVSLNMLYAMEAALSDRHWNALSPEERARLRTAAEGDLEVRPSRAT